MKRGEGGGLFLCNASVGRVVGRRPCVGASQGRRSDKNGRVPSVRSFTVHLVALAPVAGGNPAEFSQPRLSFVPARYYLERHYTAIIGVRRIRGRCRYWPSHGSISGGHVDGVKNGARARKDAWPRVCVRDCGDDASRIDTAR